MINYCKDKNKKLKEFIDALGESIHIEKTLSDASKDYLPMSNAVASIFDALKLIYIIQPAYFISWTSVKHMLVNDIHSILKEKGAIGAARAKQIETFCLETFYRYMSSVLNKRHFTLFLFFHSIFLSQNVAAAPSSKSKSKKTTTEKPEMSPRLMLTLLNEATKQNEFQHMLHQLSAHNPKPDFISLNSWINCCDLENKFPAMFANLTSALRNNSKKCLEYFHLENNAAKSNLTQKEIDLLNESPIGSGLNIFHKLLLWICIRPDKVSINYFSI